MQRRWANPAATGSRDLWQGCFQNLGVLKHKDEDKAPDFKPRNSRFNKPFQTLDDLILIFLISYLSLYVFYALLVIQFCIQREGSCPASRTAKEERDAAFRAKEAAEASEAYDRNSGCSEHGSFTVDAEGWNRVRVTGIGGSDVFINFSSLCGGKIYGGLRCWYLSLRCIDDFEHQGVKQYFKQWGSQKSSLKAAWTCTWTAPSLQSVLSVLGCMRLRTSGARMLELIGFFSRFCIAEAKEQAEVFQQAIDEWDAVTCHEGMFLKAH